ncbi:MAG: AAA family ATPase, partial [Pseudobdellovibrionaceae bacterium]
TDSSDSQNPTPVEGIQESYISRRDLPNSFTLKELKDFEFPEPCPLVENFIYKGNISLVAAKPKVGKSTLLRYLAKSIVDGNVFLGRKTIQGSVLYLVLEEPIENVQRDFLAMGVVNDSALIISQLTDKSVDVEDLIVKHSPVMIVVDTLIHATRISDMNDYSQTTRELRKFRELANKYNVHICLVHHSKKGDPQGNDSVLGSTGLTGAVDLIVTINTNSEDERVISSTGRSGKQFEKVILVFDSESKTFREGRNQRESVKDLILEVIEDNPGIGRDEIQSTIKKKSKSVTKALSELEENGEIKNRSEGRKSSYFVVDSENLGGEE